jgi:hypothetical protein
MGCKKVFLNIKSYAIEKIFHLSTIEESILLKIGLKKFFISLILLLIA